MADRAVVIPVAALRRLLLGALVLALIVTAVVVYQQRDRLPGLAGGPAPHLSSGGYQAVLLVTAQMYFGRLSMPNSELYLLSDVYYLDSPPQGEQQGQLRKRGAELHGPRDPMIIPARSVVYVENVRDDSEVMAAIRRHQKGETPPPMTPRPSPTR